MARSLPLALAALVLLACGSAAEKAGSVEAAPPPAGADLVFQREGVPGPWWRSGATQEMFDAEHRLCLARSREARREAAARGDGQPADAAYRSFLECMERYSWNRGLPPRA
ncbi:MAG: hypothetical protein ACQGVC_14350 [Myxococcota bacterium]